MRSFSFLIVCLIAAFLDFSSQTPSKVIYFPDPKNEGKLIPAFLDGHPPYKPLANESSVHLYLITSKDPDKFEELVTGDLETLQNSAYIKNASLKVMTHGFGATYRDGFPRRLSRAYLAQGEDMNIILVDWEKLAENPWYNIAAGSVKMVGNKAADLVKFLISNDYVTLDQVHIIGFSLGCHVAGNIGSALDGKAARVTALDPALPLFEIAPDDNRIDPTDAQFVDVVHAAGGYLWENGLTFFTPRGDADFYPNNGRSQPGCEGETFGWRVGYYLFRNHQRAAAFFEETFSSTTDGIFGCPCEDWEQFLAGYCNCDDPVIMGQNTPTTSNGTFFLRTRSAAPYALGKSGANSE